MSYKRKTWQEKLANDNGLPKVCVIDATKSKHWGTGAFVIPAPREVDELMRQVPKGKLLTIDENPLGMQRSIQRIAVSSAQFRA